MDFHLSFEHQILKGCFFFFFYHFGWKFSPKVIYLSVIFFKYELLLIVELELFLGGMDHDLLCAVAMNSCQPR